MHNDNFPALVLYKRINVPLEQNNSRIILPILSTDKVLEKTYYDWITLNP